MNWQPIETAPKVKDAQLLLTNGETVAQGWWCDEPGYIRERRDLDGYYIDQDESDGYTGWMDCGGGMQPDPTHWMPLPPPSNGMNVADVDWLGLALDLEAQAKRVESQTVERAMLSAAHGLRLMGAKEDQRG